MSVDREYPLRKGSIIRSVADGVLFSRSSAGMIPLTTCGEVEIDDVLDAYGDALDKIQKLQQRLSDYEGLKGVEEYYAILCKTREQQQEIQRMSTALEWYGDKSTYDIDHLSKHGYIPIDKDGGQRARAALSHQTEQPDTKHVELRSSLRWFARMMEMALQANDHKGGWENCSLEYLHEKLEEEVSELIGALSDGETILEAADVANIVFFIADNARKKRAAKKN